jgi:hypothetical protein
MIYCGAIVNRSQRLIFLPCSDIRDAGRGSAGKNEKTRTRRALINQAILELVGDTHGELIVSCCANDVSLRHRSG